GEPGLPPFVLGDFDKDGDLDVLRSGGVYNPVTGEDDLGIVALLGDGAGGLEEPVLLRNLGGLATALAAGDLDEDGDLDVVVAYSIYNPVTYENDPVLRVVLSNGDGTFDPLA